MKKLLVLVAAVVASVPGFAFSRYQTKPAVDTEVHQRALNGDTLNMQVAAGKTGGVKPEILACSLVDDGNAPKAVVDAMIRLGFDAKLVIDGAICKGANRDALVLVAVGLGGDPTALLAPTAAGGSAAGGIGENGSSFNGRDFGQSRAATVGGGGSRSVSKS